MVRKNHVKAVLRHQLGLHMRHGSDLSKGSSFIREDVLYLPEFLVKSGSAGFAWSVRGTVVHFDVPVNEEAVCKPDKLHTEKRERANRK